MRSADPRGGCGILPCVPVHAGKSVPLRMRIGGDEFALITGMEDEAEAQELAERILEQNGTPVVYEGKEYPLFLWCGFTRILNSLRYSDFFLDLHEAIGQSKGDKG